ncbi:macro domain-containing protein [Streptomyces cacaoi]|uniref:hypothetical protein n=1 Tax=Streptomyces cacaoi TaxID=1898 RepID=UPI003324940F
MPDSPMYDYASILGEVKAIRRVGLVRLRELELPSLARVCAARADPGGVPGPGAVERLLRAAVARTDAGTLQEAAEFSLGLAQGTRDWPPADRRRRAARLYGVSVERFRKHQELMVLGQVAEEILRLAEEGVREPAREAAQQQAREPGREAGQETRRAASAGVGRSGTGEQEGPDGGRYTGAPAPARSGWGATGTRPTHRRLGVVVAGRRVPVTLHVHPVDLLRDVDVIVSPVNVHFALPEPFKASVAASLRRAGALRDAAGGLVEDRIHDELRGWAARHGVTGRAALPGTVAPTGPGALADQGIRRLYHAAVTVPRAGTNDYDVLPADVTRAVTRVFALLAAERDGFAPPLRSVCFPLLGSGRGGLPYAESLGAVWTAVEAELARGSGWDVHLVVRHPQRAGLVERLLTGGPPPGGDPVVTGRKEHG